MTVRRPLVLVDGQFRQLPAGDTLEAAQGFFRTVAIAATAAGQTMYTVPGGYTPGAIFVSLNGSALAPADFTAADGASVVLESGAGIVVGSVLLVYVLSAFEVADALPLGGTAADASKLGGVVAAQFFRRSNILGIVSQSGGVPTGAIIERGSNANGEYTRYADGTQECWSPIITSVGVAVTTAAAGGFRGTQNEWQFPAEFSSPPTCVHSTRASTHQQGELRALSTTLMQPSAWCATSNPSVSCAYQARAIGRWY